MISSTPTLVKIDTHSLALYTHGPEPASSESPVVFFIPGLISSSLVWAAVVRELSGIVRCYTYDRSGFSNSESSPLPPTAENIALELSALIKNAPITNPLVMVGHSWAGIIINEYIARTGTGNIAGLVLVDANHEIGPQILNVHDPVLMALFNGIEPYSGKGIEAEHKLTKEEWDAFRDDESAEKYCTIAEKELPEYAPSFETLRKKELSKRQPLLGDKPVYVIGGKRSRDWGAMYKASVAKGNGTEEQRAYVRDMIRTADEKSEVIMKEHLKLSTNTRTVIADKSGHFVQLTQPDLVVEGVKWVMDNVGAQ